MSDMLLAEGGGADPDTMDGGAEFPDGASILGGEEDRSPAALAKLFEPKGPIHRKMLARLVSRRQMAERFMGERYPQWREVDTYLRGFVNPAQLAKRGDGTTITGSLENPWEQPVVIPVSASLLDVRRMQEYSLLTRRDIEFDGNGPEDIRPAKLMSAVASYSLQQMNWRRVCWSICKDIERYGTAIIYDVWEEEHGWTYGPPPLEQMLTMAQATGNPKAVALVMMLGQQLPDLAEPQKEWGLKKEWVNWSNIDPYFYWPDPRVPIWDVQNGEFVGHRSHRSHMWLEERRVERGGPFINVTEAKKRGSRTQESRESGGNIRPDRVQSDAFMGGSRADEKDSPSHTLDHFQVKLIPKEWGLPGGNDPEIWWFTLLGDRLIVRAHPSAYDHGEFTYAVGQADHDPHTLWVPGNAELLLPSQRLINWLANSHYENVRKALNNQLIYDDMMIEEGDLLNPGPMWHVRLTKEGRQAIANGAKIGDFVMQLPIVDITKGHLDSIRFTLEMLQRQFAANDPAQGVPTQDERTLGEVQAIMASSNQRIAMATQIIDAMMIQPAAMRMAQDLQQFMSQERYYQVTGDLAREGEMDPTGSPLGRIMATRAQLMGQYDYSPVTAMTPDDPTNSMQFWQNVMGMMLQYGLPQVPRADGRVPDLWKIFEIMLQTGGVKNVNDLFSPAPPQMMMGGPPVQVQSDESVRQQVDAGNLVPIQ
jgi:hypothetical protein